MPNEPQKKSFGTIAILGLIIVVLSSILFLLPTLSNDQSESYNFNLPIIGAGTVHRNQLMFILVAELFFMGGIYLLVKGLRSGGDETPAIGQKRDSKKSEPEEPEEQPSSLENVLADEKKAEDTKKAEEATQAPPQEKKKEEEPSSEPIRTTGPIHLSNGTASPAKEAPVETPKEAAPAAPK